MGGTQPIARGHSRHFLNESGAMETAAAKGPCSAGPAPRSPLAAPRYPFLLPLRPARPSFLDPFPAPRKRVVAGALCPYCAPAWFPGHQGHSQAFG